jgi:septal ring factor EnvC (AmiA/AmiB activator)
MLRLALIAVVTLIAATGALALRARAQATPAANPRVTERLAALEREAASLAKRSRTLIGEVRKLEVERDLRVEQARQAENAARAAREAIDEVRRKLQALEAQRTEGLPALREQFVDLYKRGRRGELALLLSANGLREFARASRAAEALAFRRQRIINDYERTLTALRAEREMLTVRSRELRAEETRAVSARRASERAVTLRAALLDDIDARRDLTAQYLSELQQAYDRLGTEITSRASGRIVEPASIPVGPFRGALDWPVVGRLAGGFGTAGATGAARNGIEVSSAINTPVRAVHDGTVDYAEGYTGLGTLVIVDHGADTYSLYGYLAEALVKRGDPVRAGAELGRVGLAPVGGQPTLYFELRVDGRLVDPVQWLKPR